MIRTINPQQAVDWKAAACCSSPRMQLAVSKRCEELYSRLAERSENAVDGFGYGLQESTSDQQSSKGGTACSGCGAKHQAAHLCINNLHGRLDFRGLFSWRLLASATHSHVVDGPTRETQLLICD
jgi:hypothetical protein